MNSRNIWSLFSVGEYKSPLKYLHCKGKELEINSNYLFLRYCLFEKITNRAITAYFNNSVIIDSSTFFECSHNKGYGAYNINIQGISSCALIKTCFIGCFAPVTGVGDIVAEANQLISVKQCVITSTNFPSQKDIIGFNRGIKDIREENSSLNTVDVSPLLTSIYGNKLHIKLCFCGINTISRGGMYCREEPFELIMCIFANITHTSTKQHGLLYIHNTTSTPYIVNCDFVNNKALLISYEGQTNFEAIFDSCFIDEMSLLTPFSKIKFISNSTSTNKEYIWIVKQNECNQNTIRLNRDRILSRNQILMNICFSLINDERD